MAPSVGKLVLVAVLAVTAAAVAQPEGSPRQLTLAMDSIAIDGATNLMRLGRPRITQDDMTIEADEALATSTDFDARSEWRFMGNVRIEAATAVLTADSAVFVFEGKQLSHGDLVGAPASFTDQDPARQKPVTGGASLLSYDNDEHTVRLTDNAWLQRDEIEARGCDIIYNIDSKRYTSGSSTCEDRFRIIVRRPPDEQTSPADPPQ